jgi:hypothetical protein
MKQARRLADDIDAIRGRVHAVVMLQRILSAAPNASAFLPSRVIADSQDHLLSIWVDSTLSFIQPAARLPTQARSHSIEARRESLFIQGEAET